MENFKMKLVSSMEKIFLAKEPSGDGAEEKLMSLKGETVSFQIGYYWGGDRKLRGKVKVNSPKNIQVRVRTVDLVPCAYPCHMKRDEGYLVTEPGLYPDLLSDITEFGFPLVSGQWRSLWVDLETTDETKAGEYPVEIILEKTDDGKELCKITVSLEVLDAVLPELDIPHTEWFHSDCLANYYHVEVFSEEHWRIVENFVTRAVTRGCNTILTPIFTPPLDTAVGGERRTVQLVDITVTDGGYEFDYEKFERWIAMCQRAGVKFFEISHLFSQWGATSTPKIVGMVNGKEEKIFGWQTKADSKEYAEFLHTFLDSFIAELKKMDIEKQCFFHISDEPSQEQLESYRTAKNLVKDQLKEYRLIDALSDHQFYKNGVIEEPVCANDHIEPFLEDRPERLWTYYCTAQCQDVSNRFIALPGFRTRILGAQLYKYRIDGFLHWGYNFYNSEYSLYPIDPYKCTDSDGAFPSGDPFLVYPGKDGQPQDSIRIMLMDETMADLRAMKYLESLTDRETVMECLDEKEYGELTFKKYPQSASYVGTVRGKVNKAIKEALK
ncbi:MAG: DUF4091 domain-containing protein [Oliverpabstia sp.]|nr:DUF4091 domain-containing protein [Lachnospiraceae bacterium]MDY5027117.1 DUF4091 domain-containing protein [Oliverpabstia sp.]